MKTKLFIFLFLLQHTLFATNYIGLAGVSSSKLYIFEEDIFTAFPIFFFQPSLNTKISNTNKINNETMEIDNANENTDNHEVINNFYIKGLELGYQYNDYISFFTMFDLKKINIYNKKISNTSNLGIQLNNSMNNFNFSLNFLYEISNKYNGISSNFNISKLFKLDKVIIIPYINIEYQDKKSSDYYYGIEFNNLKYSLNDSINYSFGFNVTIPLSKNISTNIIYNNKIFDEKISKSPIIQANNKKNLIYRS